MYLSQKVTRFVSAQRSAAFKSVPIHSSLKRIFSIGQQICKIITYFSVRNGNNITWEDGGAYSVSDKNIFSTCRASLQPTASIHLSYVCRQQKQLFFFESFLLYSFYSFHLAISQEGMIDLLISSIYQIQYKCSVVRLALSKRLS